jgi:uncharacterized membrane protein
VIGVKAVAFDAPWDWLGAGWRDLWTTPGIGLAYGAVFATLALALVVGLFTVGWQSMILALAGGFLLLGPMFAVGLYEASRRLEAREAIDPRDIALVGVRSPGQLAFMGLLLLMLYFAWLEIAFLLFMLFMGGNGLPPLEEFVPTLLFTARGLGLLIAGTISGAILAAIVFAVTAVSIPLLMVRDVDAVTAIMTSVRATLLNWKPMALWAVLIVALMACGIATLFVGLVVAFPLIGHASWHAFRSLVEPAVEPEIVPDVLKR